MALTEIHFLVSLRKRTKFFNFDRMQIRRVLCLDHLEKEDELECIVETEQAIIVEYWGCIDIEGFAYAEDLTLTTALRRPVRSQPSMGE